MNEQNFLVLPSRNRKTLAYAKAFKAFTLSGFWPGQRFSSGLCLLPKAAAGWPTEPGCCGVYSPTSVCACRTWEPVANWPQASIEAQVIF